jgi:hypothetical protein
MNLPPYEKASLQFVLERLLEQGYSFESLRLASNEAIKERYEELRAKK